MSPLVVRLLPFLRWFPMSRTGIRTDVVAGVTVALVLVPQSMAYAQLAGLPVVYGLYASFVPVIIASLWGSSSQLHTGPVAMLSLMSAAALIPFATPGSATFIELSVMLALMVGILRLLLGALSLGAIVNLLSSPVIVGFTNAAALIIGLSQLSKVIGVPFPRTESYLADLWRVVMQVPQAHLLTVLFAVGAWLLIAGLRRVRPNLPGVLIAVVAATALSALIGFEKTVTVDVEQIRDGEKVESLRAFQESRDRIKLITSELATISQQAKATESEGGLDAIATAAALRAPAVPLEYELDRAKRSLTRLQIELHALALYAAADADGDMGYYLADNVPGGRDSDAPRWHFVSVDDGRVTLSAGGSVVGEIPQGLPSLQVPVLHWDLVWALLPAAIVMALIGFMEATSISKAIATKTGDRVDTNRELIGQGLANIAGSFFNAFTVSGSFSRSAVAARMGAQTGLFAIISALAVVLVLLFFTRYLYHLPQAVLAVIVMMAVFGLIRVRPLVQAWRTDRVGAIIGIVTFIATLVMAPAIANGILLGIALTVLHFLIRTMRPRADIVARKPDGTLGGIRANRLQPLSEHFVPVRFDGSLTFINVAYFEDIILEANADFPKAKAILVIGSGINDIDASGEEKIREVAERLRKVGVRLMFSGLKHQVRRILQKGGVCDELGRDAFYSDKETALRALQSTFAGAR
ncbi:MAG: SulP family inorganic anion transporter [Gammaproteobacteria bacterium]|nr:SulP family inorganic anion transporter [Gammaproteobacteria bacterium]